MISGCQFFRNQRMYREFTHRTIKTVAQVHNEHLQTSKGVSRHRHGWSNIHETSLGNGVEQRKMKMLSKKKIPRLFRAYSGFASSQNTRGWGRLNEMENLSIKHSGISRELCGGTYQETINTRVLEKYQEDLNEDKFWLKLQVYCIL